MTETLPVPVKDYPYWRVRFKPLAPQPNDMTIPQIRHTVEQNRVTLRGWDYPHCSTKSNEWQNNSEFVASWTSWETEIEYWRMYKSHQFIHLLAVGEVLEKPWESNLRNRVQYLLDREHLTQAQIKGCISITNWLYITSEIFEFAARLCSAGFYVGELNIELKVIGVKDFVLATDEVGRHLFRLYKNNNEEVRHNVTVEATKLLGTSREAALTALIDLFHQFGWQEPPLEGLRKDQAKMFEETRMYMR
jgi:hypothetical protein